MGAQLLTAQAVSTRGDWTSSSHGATPYECAGSFVGPHLTTEQLVPMGAHLSIGQVVPMGPHLTTEQLVPMGAHLSIGQVVPSDGHVSTEFSCNHIFTEHARFELEKFCKTTELGHA